ncbi:MAG: right-handed parallel beta-helix repeat-containing protein, partial [Pseudomonadota bacterium]
LQAGDHLVLKKGNYNRPIIVTGIAGTPENPIVIEAEDGVVFTSGLSLKKYTARANRIALRRESAGYYPSVGQTADEAALAFVHCRHIIVKNLQFKRCWPTAVYLDDCQHVQLEGLKIREGTIAIGANGLTTRDITVCDCHWQQDVSNDHKMWNSIAWSAIHGASGNGGTSVDPDADYRAWDGDFFRAWDVSGNIVIRNNTISDAFNGIHFFNRIDQLAPGVNPKSLQYNGGRRSSANVLIEKNTFTRIRDNAIEPEYFAWNWVVRHNIFADCYRPFSFDLDRSGWFYIYGNYGWVKNPPSEGKPGLDRNKCSHFKLGGLQQNEGNIHVFFNSWYYEKGKGIFPKGALKNLRHQNNAIGFKNANKARMFGDTSSLQQRGLLASDAFASDDLSRHFTRQWDALHYNIVFDGDIAEDADFPGIFRNLGFALGSKSKPGAPGFAAPEAENPDLTLDENAPALKASIAMAIELPDNTIHQIQEGMHVGAYQAAGAYDELDSIFTFLPEVANPDWDDAPEPDLDGPSPDPPETLAPPSAPELPKDDGPQDPGTDDKKLLLF